MESQTWVRFHLKSPAEITDLLKTYQVEIFRSTLRRIDPVNLIVEGYITKSKLNLARAKYNLLVLDDVDEAAKRASKYVSKGNRYKKTT